MEEKNYGRQQEPGDEMREERDRRIDAGEEPTVRNEEPSGHPSGHPGGHPGGIEVSGPASLSPQDERTWSVLSHVSVLLWPVTGLLPVAPFILWLVYKDRSPRVGFHALQSLWYQAAWFALATVGGFLGTLFMVLTLGLGVFVVAPLAAVLGLVPFVHQLYAAYKVSQGADYR